MIEYEDQCEHVKSKIQVTIRKLMKTEMKVHQAHMNFNMCMLTNVFFGCGIAKFNDKQIKELRRMHE